MSKKKRQCEGWWRYGVFTFGGTTTWRQCENDAVVVLEGTQVDADASNKWVPFKQPACQHHWDKGKEYENMNIIKATSIKENTYSKDKEETQGVKR